MTRWKKYYKPIVQKKPIPQFRRAWFPQFDYRKKDEPPWDMTPNPFEEDFLNRQAYDQRPVIPWDDLEPGDSFEFKTNWEWGERRMVHSMFQYWKKQNPTRGSKMKIIIVFDEVRESLRVWIDSKEEIEKRRQRFLKDRADRKADARYRKRKKKRAPTSRPSRPPRPSREELFRRMEENAKKRKT